MKHIVRLTFLLFGFFLNVTASAQDLEVTIKNIHNDKGVLMIGLFNSEKTFTKEIWKGQKPKAVKGEITVIFKNIPHGEYALSVFQDENENGKLDTNLIGIPKEGFGFSNDVMGTFGPPSFDKAKLTIPATKVAAITMKYL